MRKCRKCGVKIPTTATIDGKKRNLCNRMFCLECSPFGKHNTRDITKSKPKRGQYTEAVKQCQRKKKLKAVEYMGGKCLLCGYNKCASGLTFHHIDPSTKEYEASYVVLRRSWEVVVEELRKCILVCRNCHAEIHDGFHEDKVFGNKCRS